MTVPGLGLGGCASPGASGPSTFWIAAPSKGDIGLLERSLGFLLGWYMETRGTKWVLSVLGLKAYL